jgi:hypothetical protein
LGGGFEEIGGRLRPALAASSSALFVGGRFQIAGGEPRSNFAVFDLPTRIDQATMPVDGVFRLNLIGPLGRVYVFEASTNLVDWSPILTNRAPFLVEDREALTMPRRFYRAVPAR